MRQAFADYTAAVLSYRLGDGGGGYRTRPHPPGSLGPIARQGARAGCCVLLGAGRGEAAREMAGLLPPDCELIVCELYPEQARRFGQGLPLMADASAVALAWLLFSVGLYRGKAFCALNPELDDPQAKANFQVLQKLHSAFEPQALPQDPGQEGPRISVAAILHPGEPDLAGFFASLPGWACEAVAVWDADSPPDSPPPCPVPVRHLARPLGRDFAGQRNHALAACAGEWALFLDADERLEPSLAGLVPALAAHPEACAFAFPRLALTPAGVKAGWGLWPDLQPRLVRRAPGVRFVRPVHERLEGLRGPTGLVVGAHILHLCDLLKDREAVAGKLAFFDAAGGRGALHRQNARYPSLPLEFFRNLAAAPAVGIWPEAVRFAPL